MLSIFAILSVSVSASLSCCSSSSFPQHLLFIFIHSGHFYSASSSPLLLRDALDYRTDTVSQATVGKGLAQGLYVAARAGIEPTTLRLRVIDLTNNQCAPKSNYIHIFGHPPFRPSSFFGQITYCQGLRLTDNQSRNPGLQL